MPFAFVWLLLPLLAFATEPARGPNIVVIYADDIGWGDFGCQGAKAIPTPNLDRLASQGARFTSAYATSATCTPSRYGLLTGEYPWRRRGTGVLAGDAPLILPLTRPTLATVLREQGYATAVVGKWHLGLGPRVGMGGPRLNWNQPITPGPREVGFDFSFIMAATGDRVPCVYVRNGRVVGLDAADPIVVNYQTPFPGDPDLTHPEQRRRLKMDWSHGHNMAEVNGVGRIGWMQGGKAARWDDTTMGDVFIAQAEAWLTQQAQLKRPFLLFYGSHENHVPRVVHPRHAGATSLGPRGDAIVAFDEQVGKLLAKLERLGLRQQTLVLVTSDNGPVLDDGYQDEALPRNQAAAHFPAGPFRGGKYTVYQGGTRVPFLAFWPGVIKPGTVSDGLLSQVDLPATLTRIAGGNPAAFLSLDSLDLSGLLKGGPSIRDHVVLQGAGRSLALREGPWTYVPAHAGVSSLKFHGPGYRPLETNLEQLYHLEQDPGETTNLATQHPEVLARLRQRLSEIKALGSDQPLPP